MASTFINTLIDNSGYIFYSFIVLVILLQLVYIHTQLRWTRRSLINKGLAARSHAQEVSHQETRLRVYPLFINLKMINVLTNESRSLRDDLKTIIDRESHILPYVCSQSVENVNVNFTKVGLLVTDMGGGADSLYTDIKNNYTRYIILKDKVFMLSVNDSVNEYLIQRAMKRNNNNKEDEVSTLENSRIFILFPLHNHEVHESDKKKVESAACRFELAPFLGVSSRRAGSEYIMNLNIEVIPNSVASRVPMHVIGYRT